MKTYAGVPIGELTREELEEAYIHAANELIYNNKEAQAIAKDRAKRYLEEAMET